MVHNSIIRNLYLIFIYTHLKKNPLIIVYKLIDILTPLIKFWFSVLLLASHDSIWIGYLFMVAIMKKYCIST